MRRITLAIIGAGLMLLTSCVSSDKFQSVKEENERLSEQAAEADSLEQAIGLLQEENRRLENYYQQDLMQLENLIQTNRSLNAAYKDLKEDYQQRLENFKSISSTSSYEKLNLTEQIAAYKAELARKERYISSLELELARKEDQLGRAQSFGARGYNEDLAERDRAIRQLRSELERKDAIIQDIRNSLTEAMRDFSRSEFSITEDRGQLMVSMSQQLLFRSGSNKLDREGRRAIRQLAQVLRNNQDIDIIVEGHTDTDGETGENWDLSVLRATTVVKELTDNGVDPRRLTASGRAFYEPVASNNSASGKAQNRRTEIIITPKLEELMDLVKP